MKKGISGVKFERVVPLGESECRLCDRVLGVRSEEADSLRE